MTEALKQIFYFARRSPLPTTVFVDECHPIFSSALVDDFCEMIISDSIQVILTAQALSLSQLLICKSVFSLRYLSFALWCKTEVMLIAWAFDHPRPIWNYMVRECRDYKLSKDCREWLVDDSQELEPGRYSRVLHKADGTIQKERINVQY